MRGPQTTLTQILALPAIPTWGPVSQNTKLKGSPITDVPEIEEAKACMYMQANKGTYDSPLCPGCWAAKLLPIRQANWRSQQVADRHGILRLGNWREITPEDYAAFKAGTGQRQDGSTWVRPDFTTRPYFLITRGLLPMSFYEEVARDPLCLNIQVSVDIIRIHDGSTTQVPGDGRIQELVGIDKVLFRFKTRQAPATLKGVQYEANVQQFIELQERLAVPWTRVLETPLRLGDHSYQTRTPLENQGVAADAFLRCNTKCEDCHGTNGETKVLGCAVTPRIQALLARVGNTEPYRVKEKPRARFEWTTLTKQVWRNQPMALQDIYAGVKAVEPRVIENPYWQLKIRQVVQRIGHRVGPATWQRCDSPE